MRAESGQDFVCPPLRRAHLHLFPSDWDGISLSIRPAGEGWWISRRGRLPEQDVRRLAEDGLQLNVGKAGALPEKGLALHLRGGMGITWRQARLSVHCAVSQKRRKEGLTRHRGRGI